MNMFAKYVGILLFLLAQAGLQAQNHYTLQPNNVTQTTNQILIDFDHLIDISPGDLKTHLVSVINPANYCSTCPNTLLEFQGAGQPTIQLNWQAVQNTDYYELQYINLSNGSTQTFTETSTSLTLTNLPDGPYAFSIVTFGTYAGVQKSSAADIIILETPLLVGEGITNCACSTITERRLKITNSTVNFSAELNKRYKFEITYDTGQTMAYILKTVPTTITGLPLYFHLQCKENLTLSDGSNTFYGDPPLTTVALFITYYSGQFYFHFYSEQVEITSVIMTECAPLNTVLPNEGKLEQSKNNSSSLKVFPNPGKEVITISDSSTIEGESDLLITDKTGKIVYRAVYTGTSFEVDVQDWSSGMYQIKLLTKTGVKNQLFLKVN